MRGGGLFHCCVSISDANVEAVLLSRWITNKHLIATHKRPGLKTKPPPTPQSRMQRCFSGAEECSLLAVVQHVPGTLYIFPIQRGDLNKKRGCRVQFILLATIYLLTVFQRHLSLPLPLPAFLFFSLFFTAKAMCGVIEANVGVDSAAKLEEQMDQSHKLTCRACRDDFFSLSLSVDRKKKKGRKDRKTCKNVGPSLFQLLNSCWDQFACFPYVSSSACTSTNPRYPRTKK